jgi:hypothetical protein
VSCWVPELYLVSRLARTAAQQLYQSSDITWPARRRENAASRGAWRLRQEGQASRAMEPLRHSRERSVIAC